VCTPPDLLDAGVRTFRVDNTSDTGAPVRLVNLNSGASVDGIAPPGSSFWDVPGVNGRANTTQLVTGSVLVDETGSINRTCVKLGGTAECDPPTGEITVTWTDTNFNSLPVEITVTSPGVVFTPNPMAAGGLAGGRASATESVTGTAEPVARALEATFDLGAGRSVTSTADVTLPPCEAPLPPAMTLSFTKTADVGSIRAGQTVSYTYAGTNTSTIPLEVLQLVDDRLGVLLEEPQATIVQPGKSLARTVSYLVRPTDAGTTIENNAVVTVSDPSTARTAQATAGAAVAVALPAAPEEPVPPTVAPTTSIASSEPPDVPATTSAVSPTISVTSAAPGGLPVTGPPSGRAAPGWLVPAAVLCLLLGVTLSVTHRPERNRRL
jgi:hypothetical protein